jgi:hypothetical protein
MWKSCDLLVFYTSGTPCRSGHLAIEPAHVESNKVRATYNKALLVAEPARSCRHGAAIWPVAEAENVIPLRPNASTT